mgnify:CR=1 FL=1
MELLLLVARCWEQVALLVLVYLQRQGFIQLLVLMLLRFVPAAWQIALLLLLAHCLMHIL